MAEGERYVSRRSFLKTGSASLLALTGSPLLMPGCTTKQVGDIMDYLVELAELINDYRKKNGLPEIPISSSLTAVALKHVIDLNTYHPEKKCGKKGNLHSWSNNGNWKGKYGKGSWKGCCYPDDHSNAACMWEKPKEITNYPDKGYELAHWESGTVTAKSALASWKSSPLHNDVILNKGMWSNRTWKALGAAHSGSYACTWFGEKKA